MRLKKAYVEITNQCNLSCFFCPQTNRPPRSMTKEEFSLVARGLSGIAESIYLHVKGEPLLHPLLGEFIDIAEKENLPVTVTTNATLLAARVGALAPKPALKRINASLHGLSQLGERAGETLEGIFDAAEKIIALNRGATPGFLVSYRLWTADDGPATRFTAEKIAGRYGIDPLDLADALSKKGGYKIHENAAVHAAETFVWPSLDGKDFGESGFCRGLRDQIGILSDGTVVPCCLDGEGAIALGNAFSEDIAAILDGKRAKALYKSFTDRKITEPLCRRCGYRTRFSAGSGN